MASKLLDNIKRWFKHYFRKENRTIAIATICVIVVVVAAVAYYAYINISKSESGIKLDMSALKFWEAGDAKLAQDAVDFINNNGLASSAVTLVSHERTNGVIKIKIKIDSSEYDSYITRDGKYLFPSALEMETPEGTEETGETTATASAASCDDLTKTDSPMLDVYVVSACPYGLQIQRAIAQAVSEVPELANYVTARYIGSVSSDGKSIESMHGEEEATENLRQICIRQEQPVKYWNYVSCYIKAGDSASCLSSAGVNSSTVSACMADAGRGVAYAKEDFDLSEKYSVSGSPTLILGDANVDESGFGGRSADAIKQIVCCASNSKPSFCSKTLETASAATSYSEDYSGSGSTSTASCD